MTTKTPDLTDLNALAMDACDMWQEHLSNLANNPDARAELTRFLEPQRRLFADWVSVMQRGGTAESARVKEDSSGDEGSTSRSDSSAAAAPEGCASAGDDPLRFAQLALRLAELEKRVAQLEKRGME
ncbi:MAG: hypothetical protein PHS57_00130 [Alphaproteobacteria bacterium]|nr:hypothetical protein [Alphaproteobacteria bacterium]